MIRLTLLLCAALYAVMVVFSQTPEDGSRAPVEVTRTGFDPTGLAPPTDAPAPAEPQEAAMTIPGPDGSVIEVADIIVPSEMARSLVQLVRPIPEITETPQDQTPAPAIRYVSGAFVNLRAGPSTGNPVVVVLPRGAEVGLIAEPGNGWSEIRDLASGQTGFMSSRFLSPDRR